MPFGFLTGLVLIGGGLAIGVTLGLFGGGGTLLALPLLIAIGVAPKPAIAASLLVVAGTAAAAAAAHLRAGNVDWRATALFAPASMLAAFAAGRVAERMPDDLLVFLFAAVVVASAAAMLRRPMRRETAAREPSAVLLAVVGALGGALSGLVGAGGGTIYVPALALFAGLPIRRAIGTSLIVIALVATSALAGHLGHVDLPLGIAGTVGVAAVVGAWLGQRISRHAPERALRSALALLLVLVAGWLVTRESHVAAWLSRVLGPAGAGP
ncbi:MAG: sulfite exporter TauE/SafE family protein [Candidatus Limnocylindria bacterium]